MCGGFGIGCDVCCRMLGRSQTLCLRIEMATLSCTNTRNDALNKHQASRQHQKSVLEELGVQVGPNGNPLVGTPPFEVFSEVLAKLQSGTSARKIDRGSAGNRLKKKQHKQNKTNISFCLLEAKQENKKRQGFSCRVLPPWCCPERKGMADC